jgi:hypothetical protein
LFASSSWAQPGPGEAKVAEAKALFHQGTELLDTGNVEQALDRFLRSHEIVPSGKSTASAAACLERLGRYDEALNLLERLDAEHLGDLSEADRAALLPVIQGLRGKVGQIDLTTNVGGASVQVDGRPRGRIPLPGPLRANAGRHKVRVERDGYEGVEVDVDVTGGGSAPLTVVLRALRPVLPPRPVLVGPLVHLDVDDPGVPLALYRVDVGGSAPAYNQTRSLRSIDPADSYRIVDVDLRAERFVCAAPCDVTLPVETQEYLLKGEGVPSSSEFELGGLRALRISASPGKLGMKRAGIALLSVGTAGTTAGVVIVPAALNGGDIARASGVMIGVGAALLAAGIPLFLKGRTSYSISADGPGIRF